MANASTPRGRGRPRLISDVTAARCLSSVAILVLLGAAIPPSTPMMTVQDVPKDDEPSIDTALTALPESADESSIDARPAAEVALLPTAPIAPTVKPVELRRYGDRILAPAETILMTVTAYSPDARSCPGTDDGITASGYSVWTNGGFLVAADTSLLPFGSIVSVPGYDGGRPVPVLDRGGAIKGRRLDVLFPTHAEARRWGVRRLTVTVWRDAAPASTRISLGPADDRDRVAPRP